MTKKEKRKKETTQKKEETETTKSLHTDSKDEDKRKTSNSRSRSGGRRSLSSLFRKSRGRGESRDTQNLLPNDDAGNTTAPDTNPRTDPRGHLQRMTVREALARNRGRSPNRRTKKLERQILNNEPRLSGDNLSISLPHLPDHFSEDQSETPTEEPVSFEARSGSTMPRANKGRGYSEGRGAQRFRQSKYPDSNISSVNDKPVQILPLDKRKYLINKDGKNEDPTNLDTFINSNSHNDTNRTHSNRNEYKISDELSENEKRRRDLYNRFLSLREKKPAHALFPVPTDHTFDNITDTKSFLPPLNASKSTPLSSELHSMEDLNQQSQDGSEFESTETRTAGKVDVLDMHERKSTEPSYSKYGHTRASSIPVDEHMPSKSDKVKRSAYVSPRRFSRSSRTSVTSNKSSVSDTSNHSLPLEQKSHQQYVEPEKSPVKYQRFFSRESRKKQSVENDKGAHNLKEQQMIDASTSMDEICSPSITTESRNLLGSSETAKTSVREDALTENESTYVIADKEIEDGEEIILSSENEKRTDDTHRKTENCHEVDTSAKTNASSLQREVVVIDSVDSETIQTHEHESVFRPIQPESDLELSVECLPKEEGTNIHKPQHVAFDTDEIEVISSDLLTDMEQNGSNVDNRLVDSEIFIEQKDLKDSNEDAAKISEGHGEKADKHSKKFWSGKSKKEKRKSKKKKEKHRKGSCVSNKSTEKESTEIEDLRMSTEKETSGLLTNTENNEPCKGKKRKSILKRRSKEKHNKSSVGKPVKRTASLSKFIDKRESIVSEERRQSTSIATKRSRSMDDISKESAIKEISIGEKNLKGEALKTKTEIKENKTVETKEVKPQPKLSIAAIVAIRAKVSRMKKAKQLQGNMKTRKETEEQDLKPKEISPEGDHIQETGENADMSVAKVFYENEINTSIGKSDNSLSIIEDTDQEVKDLVYDKRIQFSPYCDDTISEEEMIKQRQRNTRLTSRRESKVRQRQKKVINCCKKGIAFLFSHIGLCSLVVGYCILGGIVFKALEGDNEIKQKKEIRELRQNFTEKIYRFAFETTLTKGSREVFIQEVNDILKNFSVMIHKQTKEAGWDGKEIRIVTNEFEEPMEPEPEQWSYPSSLLYAITVMTTIGYGHVAPKTDEGRIMTIAYAVLGIPLTLLCLTNIGDLMAHGFRSLYGKVCCGLCCILFRPRRRRRSDPEKGLSGAEERMIMQENEKSGELIHVPTSVCLLLMSSYIMLGTFLFAEWEDWDVVTGTYFCFITLSTIGFGDVVPGMSQSDWDQQEKLVSCALYLVFGLSLIAMCFNLVQEDVKAKCKWLGMKLGIIDKPVSSV